MLRVESSENVAKPIAPLSESGDNHDDDDDLSNHEDDDDGESIHEDDDDGESIHEDDDDDESNQDSFIINDEEKDIDRLKEVIRRYVAKITSIENLWICNFLKKLSEKKFTVEFVKQIISKRQFVKVLKDAFVQNLDTVEKEIVERLDKHAFARESKHWRKLIRQDEGGNYRPVHSSKEEFLVFKKERLRIYNTVRMRAERLSGPIFESQSPQEISDKLFKAKVPNDKAFAKDLLRKWKATKDLKYLRDELFWQCFDNHCKRKEVEEFTQEYRKQEKERLQNEESRKLRENEFKNSLQNCEQLIESVKKRKNESIMVADRADVVAEEALTVGKKIATMLNKLSKYEHEDKSYVKISDEIGKAILSEVELLNETVNEVRLAIDETTIKQNLGTNLLINVRTASTDVERHLFAKEMPSQLENLKNVQSSMQSKEACSKTAIVAVENMIIEAKQHIESLNDICSKVSSTEILASQEQGRTKSDPQYQYHEDMDAIVNYHKKDLALYSGGKMTSQQSRRDYFYVVYPFSEKFFPIVKVGTSRLQNGEHYQRYATYYCKTVSFRVLIGTSSFTRNQNDEFNTAIAVKRIKLETIFKNLFNHISRVLPNNYEVYSKWATIEGLDFEMFPLYCLIVAYFATASDREMGLFQRLITSLTEKKVCLELLKTLKDSDFESNCKALTLHSDMDFSGSQNELSEAQSKFDDYSYAQTITETAGTAALQLVSKTFDEYIKENNLDHWGNCCSYQSGFDFDIDLMETIRKKSGKGKEVNQASQDSSKLWLDKTSDTVSRNYDNEHIERHVNFQSVSPVAEVAETKITTSNPKSKHSKIASKSKHSKNTVTPSTSKGKKRRNMSKCIEDECGVSGDEDEVDDEDEDASSFGDLCKDDAIEESDDRIEALYLWHLNEQDYSDDDDDDDPPQDSSKFFKYGIDEQYQQRIKDNEIVELKDNLMKALSGISSSMHPTQEMGGKHQNVTQFSSLDCRSGKMVFDPTPIKLLSIDNENLLVSSWLKLQNFPSSSSHFMSDGKITKTLPKGYFDQTYAEFCCVDISRNDWRFWFLYDKSNNQLAYSVKTKDTTEGNTKKIEILEFILYPRFIDRSHDFLLLLLWSLSHDCSESIQKLVIEVNELACPYLPLTDSKGIWNLTFFLKNGFHSADGICQLIMTKAASSELLIVDKERHREKDSRQKKRRKIEYSVVPIPRRLNPFVIREDELGFFAITEFSDDVICGCLSDIVKTNPDKYLRDEIPRFKVGNGSIELYWLNETTVMLLIHLYLTKLDYSSVLVSVSVINSLNCSPWFDDLTTPKEKHMKAIKKVFATNIVLIPIFFKNHFSLAIAIKSELNNYVILHLDGLGQHSDEFEAKFIPFWDDICGCKQTLQIKKILVPTQYNLVDCAIFTALFVSTIIKNISPLTKKNLLDRLSSAGNSKGEFYLLDQIKKSSCFCFTADDVSNERDRIGKRFEEACKKWNDRKTNTKESFLKKKRQKKQACENNNNINF